MNMVNKKGVNMKKRLVIATILVLMVCGNVYATIFKDDNKIIEKIEKNKQNLIIQTQENIGLNKRDYGNLEYYLMPYDKDGIDGVWIVTLDPYVYAGLKNYIIKRYTFIDLQTGSLFSASPSVVIGKFRPGNEIIRALKILKTNYTDFVKVFHYLFEYSNFFREYKYYDKKIPDSEKPFFCELSQKIRNEKLPFLDKNRINEDDPGCYASKALLEYILNLIPRLAYANADIEGYQVIFASNTNIKPIWEYVYSIMSRNGLLDTKRTFKYPDMLNFSFYNKKSDIVANILADLAKDEKIEIKEDELKEDMLFEKAKKLCRDFSLKPILSEDCIQAMENYANYKPSINKYDKLIELVYYDMPTFNKDQIVRKYMKTAETYEKIANLQTGKEKIGNLYNAIVNYLYAGNKNKADQLALQIKENEHQLALQAKENKPCSSIYALLSNNENEYLKCVKTTAQNYRKEGLFSQATKMEEKLEDTYIIKQLEELKTKVVNREDLIKVQESIEYYENLSPAYREFASMIAMNAENIKSCFYEFILKNQSSSFNCYKDLGLYIHNIVTQLNYFPQEKMKDQMKIWQQLYSQIIDNSDNIINTMQMLKNKCFSEDKKDNVFYYYYVNYQNFLLCAIDYYKNNKNK